MFQQDFHAYPYQDNSPDDLGKVMYTATELTTDINPDQRKGKCDTGNNYRGRNHRHVEKRKRNTHGQSIDTRSQRKTHQRARIGRIDATGFGLSFPEPAFINHFHSQKSKTPNATQ